MAKIISIDSAQIPDLERSFWRAKRNNSGLGKEPQEGKKKHFLVSTRVELATWNLLMTILRVVNVLSMLTLAYLVMGGRY